MKYVLLIILSMISTFAFANSNEEFLIQSDIVTGTIVIQLTNKTEQILGCEYEISWREDGIAMPSEKGYLAFGPMEWKFFNFRTEFGSKVTMINTDLNCEQLE